MIHLFPVRHHSPRSSAALRALLDAVRPEVVLVEAPSDAEPLVEALTDPDTEPPVAILGYRTDGAVGSALWPFAAYSPEYVALAWARAHGARVRLVDVPVGVALAEDAAPTPEPTVPAEADPLAEPPADPEGVGPDGFRSFEEFWEARFEAPAYLPADFAAALVAWAQVGRLRPDPRRDWHRMRDALFAQAVDRVLAEGVDPARVVLVAGAAHVAALVVGDVDPGLLARMPAPVPAALTLIPYSYTRLAEQTGYGAGNRAPRYYQRAHDAGCDFRRATTEVLVEFAEQLRLRGHSASLADVIEGSRLAGALADLRGKSEPGLDEVREAAVATLCRGDAAPVDTFLWSTVVGHAVGKVSARVARNSLQDEFWREVGARRLPRTDLAERFALRLQEPVQVETSTFLHRLRVLGVPYAAWQGTAVSAGAAEPVAGAGALARVREAWEAQWTPATDIELVRAIVHGETLGDAAGRVLAARLPDTVDTGGAADVLVEAVLCQSPRTVAAALERCEARAATDDDLASLARAVRAFDGLCAYGSTRGAAATGTAAALLQVTWTRALLRAPAACHGDESAVAPARDALRTLHEVGVGGQRVDREAWLACVRGLAEHGGVHPSCAGLAAGLLTLAGALPEAELTRLVGFRLALFDPVAGASFLEGFLGVNGLALCRSRAVVEALDQFLQAIPADQVRDSLPMLRRAFACLGPTERRYLVENLVRLRRVDDVAAAAQVVHAADAEALKQAAADVAGLMDDLDELL